MNFKKRMTGILGRMTPEERRRVRERVKMERIQNELNELNQVDAGVGLMSVDDILGMLKDPSQEVGFRTRYGTISKSPSPSAQRTPNRSSRRTS